MLSSLETQYAEAAKTILQQRFREKITIYSIAEEIAVSESTLKRAFRNCYHLGIYEYQVQLRMEKAKELLQAGDKSIKYISRQVGYKRQGAFTKIFKKCVGMCPLEWAMRNREVVR
jgi:AraC-like DNA-binding protein